MEEKQPAAQAVLSLLDFLKEWCSHKEPSRQAVKREQLLIAPTQADAAYCQSLIDYVRIFIDDFADDLLAEASFACHAYPKALLHYEKHLWQNDKAGQQWKSNKASLDFMQQVCDFFSVCLIDDRLTQ